VLGECFCNNSDGINSDRSEIGGSYAVSGSTCDDKGTAILNVFESVGLLIWHRANFHEKLARVIKNAAATEQIHGSD
jgi:hypothetical protein